MSPVYEQIPLFPERICTVCKRALSEDAFYVKDKKTGRRFSWCKDCHNARSKAYVASHKQEHTKRVRDWQKRNPERFKEIHDASRARHREEIAERARAYTASPEGQAVRRAYREANAERIKAYNAEYRRRQKAAIDAYNAAYRAAHREEMAEAARRCRAAKPDYYNGLSRAWKRNHPAERISHLHQYRARLRGVGGVVTAFEWERIKAQHDWRCAWCGRQEMTDGIRLCRDHIIPLRPGLNIPANIQPLCRSCNSTKHRRLLSRRKP